MYKSWIEFKTKNIKEESKYRSWCSCPEIILDQEDKLFNYWVAITKNNQKLNFEIDSCILKDFPLQEQAKFISRFVPNAYIYPWGADEEIVKLIYLVWDKYMLDKNGNTIKYGKHNKSNEFHKLIFESLYTLKTELILMKNINFDDMMKSWRKYPNKGGRYYNWHLLGCIPLLGDKIGLEILKNVCTLPYNDSEDLLMFGLYQYEPKTFYRELKDILLYWHKHENISYSTSTGMLQRLNLIINKYKHHNIDILADTELSVIFDDAEIIKGLNRTY